MIFRKLELAFFLGLTLLAGGCMTSKNTSAENRKFERLFCWGRPTSEAVAERFAAAGVTDIMTVNRKQYDLARKYGMNAYWGCFTPAGPHRQVLSPEEEKLQAYLSGKDLDPKMPRAERMKILHPRRVEKQHRYGGEPVREIDVICADIACFISDEDLALTRKKLDRMLDNAPADAAGIFLDYLGYMNLRGCYCEKCLVKYRKYLADKKLKDTQGNRTAFYREKLADYYNNVIGYIKSRRPGFKIAVHIYPDFRNDHLYGNRTSADYCGQTVSWYFKFDEAKIRKYTKYVLEHAKDHFANAEGLPFIGLSADPASSLGYKTPAEIEHDLRTILSAGGRTVMVCNGHDILKPGYFEVFRKYCGRK